MTPPPPSWIAGTQHRGVTHDGRELVLTRYAEPDANQRLPPVHVPFIKSP